MSYKKVPFLSLLEEIVDNRGKTCPTATDGIPLIATNCIKNENLYPTYENIRYVSNETYKSWFRGHPLPGDIIFVTKGSPGQTCWVPDPVNFCIAQDMVSIRVNEKSIYAKYLFALLRSKHVQKQIENMHVGTLIPHFKKGDFDKLNLCIDEDREVQKRIGDFYFILSNKIELNLRMNKTLESIAQAIFKEWFVDFRFPGFDGELVDGVPKGWKNGKVSDTCLVNTNSLSNKDGIDDILYVEISEVEKGFIKNISTYKRGEEPSRAKRKLYHGDIVLSTVRPNRGSYFLAYKPEINLIASTGFAVFTATKVPYSFLYSFLTSKEQIDYYGRMADGAAYPSINPSLIMNMELLIPTVKVLGLFNDVVGIIYDKIYENWKQNKILTQIRDSLLPRLMSGKIRTIEYGC